MCDTQNLSDSPVCDIFYIADGIIDPPLFSTQDDPVEVSIHHSGAKSFELGHQPDGRDLLEKGQMTKTMSLRSMMKVISVQEKQDYDGN